MAPIPIIALLFLAGIFELVILFVVVSQIHSPSAILIVVPRVVVVVILIVKLHLNACFLRYGSGKYRHRCRKHSGQNSEAKQRFARCIVYSSKISECPLFNLRHPPLCPLTIPPYVQNSTPFLPAHIFK